MVAIKQDPATIDGLMSYCHLCNSASNAARLSFCRCTVGGSATNVPSGEQGSSCSDACCQDSRGAKGTRQNGKGRVDLRRWFSKLFVVFICFSVRLGDASGGSGTGFADGSGYSRYGDVEMR